MPSTSTPMRLFRTSALAATAALLLAAPASEATVVIFDDAGRSGWSTSHHTPPQQTHVYEGTTALGTGNGQFIFEHAGFQDASHYILEFYVNTTDSTLANGLHVQMSWIDAEDNLHNDISFSTRNVPATYLVDGVPASPPLSVDTDTSTWQKIEFDMTQTAYTGWPYVAHTYIPGVDTLTKIVFRSENGQSHNMVLDNVRLVPEPASLSLLGLTVGGLLRRRRR